MERMMQIGKCYRGFYNAISWFGLICIVLTIPSALTFNININTVQILNGPQGSHFGQTLVYDEKSNSLLVGAPKDETNIRGQLIKTGSVHKCTKLSSNGVDCSMTSYNFPGFYTNENSTQGEGYGSAISVSGSGKIVTCAPLWKDVAFISKSYLFEPGRCNIVTPDTRGSGTGRVEDIHPFYHNWKSTSAKKYLPDLEYFHGVASFGFATDSTGASTFVFGVPGVTISEGGVYIKDYDDNRYSTTVQKMKDTVFEKTAYGYLGYEVKIGKFCEKDICLAAGAPNLHTFGRVKLYRWIGKDVLYHFQDLDGDKTWSYFGSVLCAVDTDRDDSDELLVGAPYYSEDNSHGFDTGKVFVYTREKSEKEYKQHLTLHGSGNKFSRFGSAIQTIGDINLDNYPDVAIGAPGEEEDSGCVYIYLGSPRGLSSKYSQRICAKEIPGHGSSLKWFGSSISNPIKEKSSAYPLFAASSYFTDKVFMFKTKVIVRANATITATPNPIDLSAACGFDPKAEPCTVFDVCYNQHMEGLATAKLDFIVKIELDTQRRHGVQQRVQIMDPAKKLVNNLGDISVIELDDKGFCQQYQVVTIKNQVSKDRFTPIEIKVTMEIDPKKSQNLDPILDPTSPNVFTYMVSLANDCGSDNICKVDLSVAGAIRYAHQDQWPHVVVGYTKEMQVDLTIKNAQETSYGTKITVELNQPLRYTRFKSDTIKQCKPVSLNTGVADNAVVECFYYIPLKQGASIEISIAFDTTNVALDKRTIKATASALPTDTIYSREDKDEDNEIQMITSVFIVADVDMFGTASPSEITIRNAKRISLSAQEEITKNFTQSRYGFDTIALNHKYQMKNMGPSYLPKTYLYLIIPAYLPDATQVISRVQVQLQSGDKEAVSCRNMVRRIEGGTDVVIPTISGVTTPSIHTDPSSSTDGGGGGPKTTTQWTPGGKVNKRRRKKRAATGGGGGHDDDDDDDDDNHDGHDDNNDYSKTYHLNCDTSPDYCITFRCEIESTTPSGGHVSLNVTLDVDKDNIPIPEGFTSFHLQLKSLVQQPKHLLFKPWSDESKKQATTGTSTLFHVVESGGEINIWIIIGSVIAGLVLILLIVIIAWKCGFFKRKKRVEMAAWKRKSQRMSKAPPPPKDDDI